jgi:hypothetical protein
VPSQTVAVITLSGQLNQSDADSAANSLSDLIAADKHVIIGKYKVIHYGPLWAPSFLEKHDIVIPIRP